MKKLFLAVCFLFFGLGSASAQISYEVPQLSHKLDSMCEEVVKLKAADPAKAYLKFAKIAQLIQNKKEDLIAVGDYFRRNKVHPCDSLCAARAYSLGANDADAVKFMTAMYEKGKDYGRAAQMYDMILEKDSNNVGVLYQLGWVNRRANPEASKAAFRRVTELDSANWKAWRYLGDLYYDDGDNEKTVKSYDAYHRYCPRDSFDVRSCENYVQSLFAVARFDSVVQMADEFIRLDPKDIIFKRMKFIGLVPTYRSREDIEKATAEVREAMKYLTEREYADSFYINIDYSNAARFYTWENEVPDAIKYLKMAIERDPENGNNYRDLSALYRRNNQYDDAIATYQTFIEKKGDENIDTNERLILMQNYFFAANQDSLAPELKEKYIAEGEGICLHAIEKAPNSYYLYIYRGRFNMARRSSNELDEASAADFARAMELMQAAENPEMSYMRDVSTRLMIYWFRRGQESSAHEDYEKAWQYDKILLGVDPESSLGKKIYEVLKDDFAPKAKPAARKNKGRRGR